MLTLATFLVTETDGSTALIPKPVSERDLVPVQSTSHAHNTNEWYGLTCGNLPMSCICYILGTMHASDTQANFVHFVRSNHILSES
jgi:hypothetical protein